MNLKQRIEDAAKLACHCFDHDGAKEYRDQVEFCTTDTNKQMIILGLSLACELLESKEAEKAADDYRYEQDMMFSAQWLRQKIKEIEK